MANFPSLWRSSLPGESNEPFRVMARMQREMDRMFDDFWSGGALSASRSSGQPMFDVDDKGSHFLLRFEIPGFTRDDVKIEVRDNALHVSGERKSEGDDKKSRSYGMIEQWFSLPPGIKAEEIEASVEHGVLQVAVPKARESEAQRVKIGDGKTGFFSKLLGKDGEKKDEKVA